MATIYKYPIPRASEPFELKIKGFCEIVHVGLDGNDAPCIWAIVNPNQPEETWKYCIVATGEEFDVGKWCHISTFMQGPLVWHLLRPVDQWEKPVPAVPTTVGSIVYVIAPKRTDGSLPGISDDDVVGHRVFASYEHAKRTLDAGVQNLELDASALCIYSVYAVTQQIVTFESPF
jgi:hypothetical protein